MNASRRSGAQRHRISVIAPALLTLACFAQLATAQSRPNILFIYSDDHAYQAIGAYGSRINTTPHIDSLAQAGMRFDNCYVTNSICAPMRACVLTGKYSHVNGVTVNGITFDQSQPTLPVLLRDAGYQTALIGKWHLMGEPQIFDHAESLIGQGTYYNPTIITDGERIKYTGYTSHIVTDRAIEWLSKGRDQDKPFLLMYQHKSPHRPFDPEVKYLNLYDDRTIPEPPTLHEDYGLLGLAARQQDMTIVETMDERDLKFIFPNNLNDEQRTAWENAYGPKNTIFRQAQLSGRELVSWKYQRFIKDYLRCVKSLDDDIGRLLAYLDETGLADNTVVVYTSDQGFYLGEHGWFDKRWMYEQSLRSPLIVRWPGVAEPGTFNDDIVTPIDFAETFLEMAGANVPADMEGHSLVPLLKGQTPDDWRKTLYYHYYEYPGWHHVRRHYGVTDGRFKLIYFYEKDVNTWEMYDLKFDPFELNNIYDNPEYTKVRERLNTELERQRRELKVPEEDPPDSFRTFPVRTRPARRDG
ncbi:MAG: sulfatase [Phycisphaerales bacterium]|nr:sulfatase [Phycisphaerales bacterium]